MKIEALRALIKRAFPGLGGWHCIIEAKVLAVYPASGTDTELRPLMVADLMPLDAEGKRDSRYKEPLAKIEISTPHPGLVALPEPGDIALVQFAGWRADKAMITGYRFRGHSIDVTPGVTQLKAALGVEIGSAEDSAVLFSKLSTALGHLSAAIEAAASSDSWGSPNQNLVQVQGKLQLADAALAFAESLSVKIGNLGR